VTALESSIKACQLDRSTAVSSSCTQSFTHIDCVDRLALVVEEDSRLVAVGRYERLPGTSDAEVAFVVTDAWQHRGIGALLLEHLALAALATGITTFVAQTLAENRDMLNVFGHSGFPVTSTTEYGTVSIRFPIASDHAFRSACAARHRHLEVGSFDGEVPT
jgi:GNAT superfamily N-acetyltransferase